MKSKSLDVVDFIQWVQLLPTNYIWDMKSEPIADRYPNTFAKKQCNEHAALWLIDMVLHLG